MNIGYLGPPGTFTQQAAERIGANFPAGCLTDYQAIEDALQAVSEHKIDLAAVPLENTTEGVVNATIDALIFEYDLYIQCELSLPIEQCLMLKNPRAAGSHIGTIYSHRQSLAQCRKYIRANYPSVNLIEMTSNAEAARYVSEHKENCAAIGPRAAAQLYQLTIAAENIQDQKNNATTFIALSDTPGEILPDVKTTIAFSTENKPGALYKVLDIFSLWDINMTKILSRPMKNRPGEYVFYVDLEDYYVKDLDDALTMVKRKTDFYKFLGSYCNIAVPILTLGLS